MPRIAMAAKCAGKGGGGGLRRRNVRGMNDYDRKRRGQVMRGDIGKKEKE